MHIFMYSFYKPIRLISPISNLDLTQMERIYTHYDNLKVARDAPPEVIRAAYKSLAHKYHPDRNQNNPGASRIMSLINIAYEELSDPVKRRLHDEWIREQEKLRHTHSPKNGAANNKTEGSSIRHSTKNRRTVLALLFFTAIIALVNIIPVYFQHTDKNISSNSVSSNISSTLSVPNPPTTSTWAIPYPHKKPTDKPTVSIKVNAFGKTITFPANATIEEMVATLSENEHLLNSDWKKATENNSTDSQLVEIEAFGKIISFPAAMSKEDMAKAIRKNEHILNPDYKIKEPNFLINLPSEDEEKNAGKPKSILSNKINAASPYVRSAKAPNGEMWPSNAAYIKGYKKLHTDGLSSVTVDNTQNDSDVFVKLVSISGNNELRVRHFFIPATDRFTVNKVRSGNYDIRYRDLDSGTHAKSETFMLQQKTTSGGIQYSNITMTLYKVRDGNMRTYAISEADF